MATFEEVFYHVVRTNTIHEAGEAGRVTFERGHTMSFGNNVLTMPEGFLLGVVFAIISSDKNSNETLTQDLSYDFRGERVQLNLLWAQKARVLELLKRKRPKA